MLKNKGFVHRIKEPIFEQDARNKHKLLVSKDRRLMTLTDLARSYNLGTLFIIPVPGIYGSNTVPPPLWGGTHASDQIYDIKRL